MSSSVLPEVVWRAFKSEDSTQFVFEVEAALLALIHKWCVRWTPSPCISSLQQIAWIFQCFDFQP